MEEQTRWEKYIPWFLTIGSCLALISIGFFLIDNINWFKKGVFTDQADLNLEYKVYAYQMHLSMIKRSVGLFSGFALMFLGTGVAFYSIKKQTDLSVEGGGLSARLVTASPGIIAMILGAFLIISTIKSKDNFPTFRSEQNEINTPITPGRVD